MPKGRYVRTEATRKKLSDTRKRLGLKWPSQKGKKHGPMSEEQKQILRIVNLGSKNPNYGKKMSELVKNKISKTLKEKYKSGERLHHLLGKHHTEETKKKIGMYNHTKEAKQKMSIYHTGNTGDKSPNWQGGITPIIRRIRNSDKYKTWRLFNYERDKFTCQDCNSTGVYLHAHHIILFSKFIEEIKNALPLIDLYEAAMAYAPLWDTNNGITLCKKCHKIRHKKNKEKVNE